MKHIKIFESEINESVAVQRVLIPEMIKVSNNSVLTADVALILANKLLGKELDDFRRWLKLITPTSEVLQLKNKAKRGF